jgi:isocitrate lyase
LTVILRPFADLIWLETSTPDIEEARNSLKQFIPNFQEDYCNCSPSLYLTGRQNYQFAQMETFREDIAKMGYKFFITLAGLHYYLYV